MRPFGEVERGIFQAAAARYDVHHRFYGHRLAPVAAVSASGGGNIVFIDHGQVFKVFVGKFQHFPGGYGAAGGEEFQLTRIRRRWTEVCLETFGVFSGGNRYVGHNGFPCGEGQSFRPERAEDRRLGAYRNETAVEKTVFPGPGAERAAQGLVADGRDAEGPEHPRLRGGYAYPQQA